MSKYKQLSDHKFANSKVERGLIRFWINASKKELIGFKNTLKLIPISAFVDGIFNHKKGG